MLWLDSESQGFGAAFLSKHILWPKEVSSILKQPVFPPLGGVLQGDTIVGKTSLISYLASILGSQCMMLNSYEHIDIQE